jgi:hypothetical protein
MGQADCGRASRCPPQQWVVESWKSSLFGDKARLLQGYYTFSGLHVGSWVLKQKICHKEMMHRGKH